MLFENLARIAGHFRAQRLYYLAAHTPQRPFVHDPFRVAQRHFGISRIGADKLERRLRPVEAAGLHHLAGSRTMDFKKGDPAYAGRETQPAEPSEEAPQEEAPQEEAAQNEADTSSSD